MEAIIDFIFNYWGLSAVVVIATIKAISDYQGFKENLKSLVVVIEEKARDYSIEHGEEKFLWVKTHGYDYIPNWLKLVLTEKMYEKLIQSIYEELFRK